MQMYHVSFFVTTSLNQRFEYLQLVKIRYFCNKIFFAFGRNHHFLYFFRDFSAHKIAVTVRLLEEDIELFYFLIFSLSAVQFLSMLDLFAVCNIYLAFL